jgi:hypothetical protein
MAKARFESVCGAQNQAEMLRAKIFAADMARNELQECRHATQGFAKREQLRIYRGGVAFAAVSAASST